MMSLFPLNSKSLQPDNLSPCERTLVEASGLAEQMPFRLWRFGGTLPLAIKYDYTRHRDKD